MQCPKCGCVLNKVTVKTRPEYGGDILNDAELTRELELDQCVCCNGIWFDYNELDAYLSEKLLILDSLKVKEYKKLDKKEGLCPRCHQKMVKKPAPHNARFEIDVCEQCPGVWLDSSELDQLEDKNLSLGEKHALVLSYFKDLFSSLRRKS